MCISGSVSLFLAKIVEVDVAEVGTQNNEICYVTRTGEVRVLLMIIFLSFFNILVCNAFFPSRAQILRNNLCTKVQNIAFVSVSRPWRGQLRHVCGHTNHRTNMVHVFLESPSNLDVHPGIRFWILEKISSELLSKSTLYGYVMLTNGSIALRLRAN